MNGENYTTKVWNIKNIGSITFLVNKINSTRMIVFDVESEQGIEIRDPLISEGSWLPAPTRQGTTGRYTD